MAYRPRWLRPTVNTRLAALDITPFEAFLEAVRQLAMTSGRSRQRPARRLAFAGSACSLILITAEGPRDHPVVAVAEEEIPRGTPTGATCEHHGLCRVRIDRRGDVNHVTPSFYERTSWHIPAFRRDNLNPGRELPWNRHREPVSSIHDAGKTRRANLRIK